MDYRDRRNEYDPKNHYDGQKPKVEEKPEEVKVEAPKKKKKRKN